MKKVHSHCSKNNNSHLFHEIIDTLSNPFQGLETSYRREKYLEKACHLIRPSAFTIGSEINPKNIRGTTAVTVKDLCGQLIPMGKVFQKFLQLPNVFNTIRLYMDKCKKKDSITSFLNGTLWLETKFSGKFLIPLLLYADDVEVNNLIGSRKGVNKICGVYCRILCIPPEYSSMLENIFVIQFHKSNH